MENTLTNVEHLDAFYKLTHAMQYLAQTRTEPWERPDAQRCLAILDPLSRELARPFREARIFKNIANAEEGL